jgi:hypothetical protein
LGLPRKSVAAGSLWRLPKADAWSATVFVDELQRRKHRTRFDRLTSSTFSRARKSCGGLREQIGQAENEIGSSCKEVSLLPISGSKLLFS